MKKKQRKFKENAESYMKLTPKTLLLYLGIVAFCVIVITPLVIVFSSSFRSPGNQTSPLNLFNEFTFESYKIAFKNMNFPVAFMNSLLTTVGSVIMIILVASMAAYPISRVKSRLARFLYYFFISGLIIPSQMVIVPIAQTFTRLGIPNTRFTPMLMFITCSLPFTVFLYVGFMKSVPMEIEESAYIDGANLFQRFTKVVFPLLKPATISVAITQGLWIWNDYFYPMVFISRKAQYSLPVAMLQFLGDKENPAQWNILFAACIFCALPLIVIFMMLQKQFINGIAAGAVKG